MPNDIVSLLIAGQSHANWETYQIDSDLMTPADSWRVTLSNTAQQLPSYVIPGANVQVQIDNLTVLTGSIDEIHEPVSVGFHDIEIIGRDNAAVLVDCSAPIFSSLQIGLQQVVTDIVMPLGIHNVRIDAQNTPPNFAKISAEPGDNAWDILQWAAEANGLWPWCDPDGTLVIGGADYNAPVVAELFLEYVGIRNNIKEITRRRSITNRFSQLTVLGQSSSNSIQMGEPAIKGQATDENITVYRPKVVVDAASNTQTIALKRARKILTDGRLDSFDLQIVVKGHHLNDTTLWTPGQIVNILSEPHGINAPYFLMGRTFIRDLIAGTITSLRFKELGIWTVDAFPHLNPTLQTDSTLSIEDISSD